MFSFLITLLKDITQTGILIFLLYNKLSSVLNLKLVRLSSSSSLSSQSMTLSFSINLNLVKSLAKIKSSSSNSSIKENTSSLSCLIILN